MSFATVCQQDSLRETARAQRAVSRRGFTLVELLVAIVIIVILASLVLGGLSAAQERGRQEQTRSTVSKIHAQVMLLWDSYRTRRVQFSPGLDRTANAQARLALIRAYQRQEMPDTYADMQAVMVAGIPLPASPLSTWVQNVAIAGQTNESAECLYLTVTYGMNADAQIKFISREVGDTDEDGNPEFIDGWGNPIGWIRWAPGFISEVQHSPLADFHPDPFDPMGVDRVEPPASPVRGFRLYPLVISPGPDGFFGIYPLDNRPGPFVANADPYSQYGGNNLYRGQDISGTGFMASEAPAAAAEGGGAADNIHGHAVGVK